MIKDCRAETCNELVRKLWEEAFSRKDISTDDNFFDLGGHSLTALTIAGRLGFLMDTEVPLRVIFDNPVLANYAEAVLRLVSQSSDQP